MKDTTQENLQEKCSVSKRVEFREGLQTGANLTFDVEGKESVISVSCSKLPKLYPL